MGDEFEIQDRDVPLAALDIRKEAPVDADPLGHLRLSPTASLA